MEAEELYQYIKKLVTHSAEAEFKLFQSFHEQSRKGAPAIKDEITIEALKKVSEYPVLQMKHFFTKEEILKAIQSEEKETRKLVEGKKEYKLVKEHKMWKDHILVMLKLDYLNALLADDRQKPQPSFEDLLNISSDKDQLIEKLASFCNVGSGKILAMIVIALEEIDLLLPYKSLKYLFELMENIFNNIGSLTGFQDQYKFLTRDRNKDEKTRIEIERFKSQLKPFLRST